MQTSCQHHYTIDLIDIDPDKSIIIYSCDHCGDIQLTRPNSNQNEHTHKDKLSQSDIKNTQT